MPQKFGSWWDFNRFSVRPLAEVTVADYENSLRVGAYRQT